MRRASTIKRAPAFVRDLIPPLTLKTRATSDAWSEKRHSCKPLPIRFRHSGFDYRQIYRKRDFAIYQQTWNGNEQSAEFEVIRIRKRDGFQIDGRFVEPAEVYPASELWGLSGFTFTNRDKAWAKFLEVTSKQSTSEGGELWQNLTKNS